MKIYYVVIGCVLFALLGYYSTVTKIYKKDEVYVPVPDIVAFENNLLMKNIGDSAWASNSSKLKESPNGRDVFLYGFGLKHFDQNESWDYEKVPFWGTVSKFSDPKSTVDITFRGPSTMPFLGKKKTVKMDHCYRYISFVTYVSDYHNNILGGADFYRDLNTGDRIISYCTNKRCTEAGIMCKIIKDVTTK